MTSICVFCGASPGRDPKHMALAKAVGQALAAGKHRLVYGGGGLGLMGAVARSANESGGWDPIIRGLHHTIEEGFAPESFAKDIHSTSTAHEALALIADKIANPNIREPLDIHNKV